MFRTDRKRFSMLLTLCVLITCLTSCIQNSNNETDSPSISEGSNHFESEASVNSSKIEESHISTEESDEIFQDTVVSFLACPDNIIHPSVFYDAIERAARKNGSEPDFSDLHNAEYDFSPIYKNVAEAIKNADIAYINQETLIGGTSGPIIGYPRFNSPLPVAENLIGLGFDVVNLAHNHMLDSGNEKYLQYSDSLFKNAGLITIGYYPDQASTENIPVVEKDGIKIAFLAYTYGTNGNRLPSKSTVVIPRLDKELITKQVTIAKKLADVIIVSTHWGYENTYNANSEQKEFASIMCELEVDVILGMHPHVIQPMEWLTSSNGYKTLNVFSLGNFVSGMVSGRNMLGGMLSLNIVKNAQTNEISIEDPVFIPIVTHYIKGTRVARNDTGYRDFEIYYLKDYTEELAAIHGVCRYERSHGTTLVGGAYSKETLINTLVKYIPNEFLPPEFRTEQ